MNPEDTSDYEALLEAGKQNTAYQDEIAKQKALAERMRSGPELAGQMVSGHYVAPNILEVVGDVMNRRNATKADAAQTAATAGLRDSMGKQRQRVLARILRGSQPSKPVVPSGMPTEPYDY